LGIEHQFSLYVKPDAVFLPEKRKLCSKTEILLLIKQDYGMVLSIVKY